MASYLPTPLAVAERRSCDMDNKKKNTTEANTNTKSNRTEFADDFNTNNCNNNTKSNNK